MTELLIRLFIRDKDNVQDPTVRQQYGTLSGLTGICLNILLWPALFLVTSPSRPMLSITYPMPVPRWSHSLASGWRGKNPIGITPSATVG